MRIGDSYWIKDYSDYKELEDAYNKGSRLASSLMFSHEIKDGDNKYYCFRPTNRVVNGCIYITESYIVDVFKLLEATVDCPLRKDSIIPSENVITFTPEGLIINHDKKIKYKYESDMVYRLQKTQYKGESPYGLLAHLVDPFWDNVLHNGFKQVGYITA